MIFCKNWRQFFRHFAKWFFRKRPFFKMILCDWITYFSHFPKCYYYNSICHFLKCWNFIFQNDFFPFSKMGFLIRSFFKMTKMRLPGINCVQSICIQYVIFLTIQIVCNIIWYDTIIYCRIFNCVQSTIIQYNLIR